MKEKGITLIALVITIIILLILASVTIATLTGDNGLITKAMEAREKTEIGAIEEQLRLAQMSAKLKKQGGDITIENLIEELEKQGVDFDLEEDGTLIIGGNYIYEIVEKDGEVAWENNGTMTTPKPKIVSIEILDRTDTTVKVRVTTIRNGGGSLIYSIKENGGKYQEIDRTTVNTSDKTQKEYTFIIDSNKLYTGIKVEAIAGNGETASKEIELINVPTLYTAQDIANSENKSQFYGATVTGYTCTNSAGVKNWKIFYADASNIYLIADDYINYAYVPKGKGGSSLNKGDTDYKLYFTDILSDYSGSSDITNEKIKALNSDYFTKQYTSTNTNMKAVAYMLDTNMWSVFAGDKADYAIGGPTIEMLMKSYNQKHKVDYRAQASNVNGYQISKDGGASWADYYSEMLDTRDSLYVINNTEKALAMWIASPASDSSRMVMFVINDGLVGRSNNDGLDMGVRPLVCLKSNVQLEKNSDKTYTIK